MATVETAQADCTGKSILEQIQCRLAAHGFSSAGPDIQYPVRLVVLRKGAHGRSRRRVVQGDDCRQVPRYSLVFGHELNAMVHSDVLPPLDTRMHWPYSHTNGTPTTRSTVRQ